MATEQDHLDQANHNQAFYSTIDCEKYPDWAATVLFYTAVHFAQALICVRGGIGGSHTRRNATLRNRYPKVWKQYHKLYSYSRLARYRCMRSRAEDVPFLESILRKVEAAVRKELSKK